MVADILEVEDQEKALNELENEAAALNPKRGRLKKCRVCGMSTYQKEGLCVLCKSGIREAGEALLAG